MNRFRQWYYAQPRALRTLLVINVAIYVLWHVPLKYLPGVFEFVYAHLALNPGLPGILFEPWQLVTYNFLHLGPGLGGLLHVVFNMLWLVWIGRDYEQMHGAPTMLALYLIAGVGGGLLTVALHAFMPGVGAFGGPVFGASASVLGVLACVAAVYPYKSVGLLFIGNVRMPVLLVGFLVIDFFLVLAGSYGTSLSAHWGGALFGYLFGLAEKNGRDLSSWAGIFFRDRRRARPAPRRAGRPPVDPDAGFLERMESWLAGRQQAEGEAPARRAKIHPLRRSTPTEEEGTTIDQEVDRILEKISEQGYEALSAEEKRVLYEASRR